MLACNRLPIICAIPSTSLSPGFQATLFVQSPMLNHLYQDYVTQNNIYASSAYLTVVEKNQRFDAFNVSIKSSICVSIDTFLDMLNFFKRDWPSIENEMEASVLTLRSTAPDVGIEFDNKDIDFYIHGVAAYQKWFNDGVFFTAKRHSHDWHQAPHLRIQSNGKTLSLDAKVMKMIAENDMEIRAKLDQRGFVFSS